MRIRTRPATPTLAFFMYPKSLTFGWRRAGLSCGLPLVSVLLPTASECVKYPEYVAYSWRNARPCCCKPLVSAELQPLHPIPTFFKYPESIASGWRRARLCCGRSPFSASPMPNGTRSHGLSAVLEMNLMNETSLGRGFPRPGKVQGVSAPDPFAPIIPSPPPRCLRRKAVRSTRWKGSRSGRSRSP